LRRIERAVSVAVVIFKDHIVLESIERIRRRGVGYAEVIAGGSRFFP
jgi:hypothetical protein